MSAYTLHERDFRSFFEVPFAQYGPECPYVSPLAGDLRRWLDGSVNPVFDGRDDITYFSVTKNGVPVGRITAHVHEASNRRFGQRRGYFGFFDCARDPRAAGILLDTAASWLAAHGCDEMAGNFNLTAMQEMGVTIGGHGQAPFLAQQYGPAWIPELLDRNGFEGFFPMTTWVLSLDAVDPDALLGPKQRKLMEHPGLTVEPILRRRFRASMEQARRLLNASFDSNPLFVPLTRKEFSFQADAMLWIFDPRIAFTASVDGEPCAVLACLPDLNPLLRATRSRLRLSTPFHYLRHRLRRTRASLVFGGVAPEMQDRGLAGLLLHHGLRGLKGAGYRELGITWISDSNGPSLRQMEKLGARPLHRSDLFRRAL